MDIKSLKIVFDFATELAYEELTGKEFNPRALVDEDGEVSSRELVNLTTAVIIAANPDVENPTAFMHENTRQEVFELFNAVGEAMHRWLVVPKVAEDHVVNSEEPKSAEEDERPNA